MAETTASGSVPEEWQAGADEVSANVKQGYADLANLQNDSLPGESKSVQAIRIARDEEGNPVLAEDGSEVLVALTDDSGNAVMEDHPLIQRANDHGLHAYRYEPCEDGSIVAVYANDAEGTVKMKPFDNIESASLWSPREER
jgi:hypothetical protein